MKDYYLEEKITTNNPEELNATTLNKSSSSSYDWKQFLKDYEEWIDS